MSRVPMESHLQLIHGRRCEVQKIEQESKMGHLDYIVHFPTTLWSLKLPVEGLSGRVTSAVHIRDRVW